MDVFAALAPSAGLLVLFIVLMRSIVLADRRERAALARARAERPRGDGAGSPPPAAPGAKGADNGPENTAGGNP